VQPYGARAVWRCRGGDEKCGGDKDGVEENKGGGGNIRPKAVEVEDGGRAGSSSSSLGR
jgi:hypothetical protein